VRVNVGDVEARNGLGGLVAARVALGEHGEVDGFEEDVHAQVEEVLLRAV